LHFKKYYEYIVNINYISIIVVCINSSINYHWSNWTKCCESKNDFDLSSCYIFQKVIQNNILNEIKIESVLSYRDWSRIYSILLRLRNNIYLIICMYYTINYNVKIILHFNNIFKSEQFFVNNNRKLISDSLYYICCLLWIYTFYYNAVI